MIKRVICDDIIAALQKKRSKIVILYGPRQVGKTTLLNTIIDKIRYRTLMIDADDTQYTSVLSSQNISLLSGLVSGYDCLYIDEAQQIPNIGINLKLLYDHFPHLKIVVSGSSSFELANTIKEPLTGRTCTFYLYPVSGVELSESLNRFEINSKLAELLLYGSYPEILTIDNYEDKKAHLYELSQSYLYKDVLALEDIRYSDKLAKLLQLLAFQIGSQVSLSELGAQLGMSQETVRRYIDLLEKCFVIFKLSGFSRNLRKEVSKMDKLYFYDLGIRNAIINNFSPIQMRMDRGQLFENFLMVERLKRNAYTSYFTTTYFWRLYTGAELDYIEECNGQLYGFEFKFNQKQSRAPQSWLDTYSNASFECINCDNYLDFILPPLN